MVRCADCGFLALRNARSRELEEADEPFRSRGSITVEDDSVLRHEVMPVCFAMAYDLRADLRRYLTQQFGEAEWERWLRTPQATATYRPLSPPRGTA